MSAASDAEQEGGITYETAIVDEHGEAPDARMLLDEHIAWIRQGLEALKEEHEALLRYVDIEGHSVREAMEHFNKTDRAIYVMLHRARKSLRQHLEQLDIAG